MTSKHFLIAAAPTLAASPALAHSGTAAASGLAAGLAHPLGGLDHVLAMVAVGLFAAALGGRALWAVPASFAAMLLAGGALGLAGVGIPAAEFGIAASVIVLGAAVALGRSWPVAAAMAVVAIFAVFHGHAHGVEVPGEAATIPYSFGFVLTSTLLHGAGVAAGRLTFGRSHAAGMTGAAVTLAGIVLAIA